MPLLLREICRVVGEAEREKSAAEFTFSVTLTEWFSVAVAPVMVGVYVPTGVLLEVMMVRVEEPDPATDAGAKEELAPEGRPLTERLTVSEKPFKAPIDTV